MPNGIAHLDRKPQVDLNRGPNVVISVFSGEQGYDFACARSGWRRFLETELRHLNEHEAAEQGRVVQMRQRGRRGGGKGGGGQRTCPD